ncbi:hypothetical protein [Qipengyuania vesicularis]|uniref:hypothetical protein n=1 Tax=Qipengyuania vesicularis TaxID=2867232 RepID=UPI001C88175D|nr:hypothetical protein [Qipengyuania vesicularis]MBX7528414.1 hypothetical protein [Qipengyuania vesicularis]
MKTHKSTERGDALLARLRRLAPDLREEEARGEFLAVASYLSDDGSRILSFCVDGLLIDPDREARFIPFSEIEATSYHGTEELKQEKSGQMSKEVTLTLKDGSLLPIPLATRSDRFSERLRIGNLIEQRVRLADADEK